MTIIINARTAVYHAKLTHLNCQLKGCKKSYWRCGRTLCYARKGSFVDFFETADGQFALCLLDSRQFRKAEPNSSRGDHAVPTELVNIQKLSISPP